MFRRKRIIALPLPGGPPADRIPRKAGESAENAPTANVFRPFKKRLCMGVQALFPILNLTKVTTFMYN
ncbi:MAG TPA: hypothetical protein DC013_10860 [Ruminococcaceae bacterium]|nr:hypothetical protein [Oscillospiraceae bacterium]